MRKSEPDSKEYGIGAEDVIHVKPEIKPEVALDPRQLTVRIAAIAIRPAPSAASSPEAQRPSAPNYRTQSPLPRALRQAWPSRPASEAGQTQRVEVEAQNRGRCDLNDAARQEGRREGHRQDGRFV